MTASMPTRHGRRPSSGSRWCRDAFDVLYKPRAQRQPKMMSVGMHMRIIGHPGRAAGLWRLLDYMQKHDGVWITRRVDIANHWVKTHPYRARGSGSRRAPPTQVLMKTPSGPSVEPAPAEIRHLAPPLLDVGDGLEIEIDHRPVLDLRERHLDRVHLQHPVTSAPSKIITPVNGMMTLATWVKNDPASTG